MQTKRCAHRQRSSRRASSGRSPLIIALLLLTIAPALAAEAAEVTVGGAGTRGFFSWAILGDYAWIPPIERAPTLLDFPLRIGGLFSNRRNITNLVFSATPTVRWHLPGFEGNDFGPYVATGPAYHLQNSWADLQEFGGVESHSESVLKWQLFLGASLVRGHRTDLIVETRYTIPSQLDFDYFEIALRFHPE